MTGVTSAPSSSRVYRRCSYCDRTRPISHFGADGEFRVCRNCRVRRRAAYAVRTGNADAAKLLQRLGPGYDDDLRASLGVRWPHQLARQLRQAEREGAMS